MIEINGYYIDNELRVDKQHSTNGVGAGILIYVRNGLKIFKTDDQNSFNQYCRFFISADDLSEKLNFTVIYRSPNSSEANNLNLVALIDSLNFNEANIILGDFNFPNINWNTFQCDNKARPFLDVVSDHSLTQIVNFPTHCKGNLLDLFLTNQPDSLLNIDDLGNLHTSDHTMILAEFSFNTEKSPTEQLYPDWKNLDVDGFKYYLNNVNWNQVITDSVENSWCNFKNILTIGCDRFLPKKRRRNFNKPIWMNQNITRLIRIKQRRFKTYKNYRTAENLSSYKESEKKCKKSILRAKKAFEKKLSQKSNDRQFYSYVNSKTKNKTNVGPLKVDGRIITEDSEMTETLNNFFSSVFTQEDATNIPQARRLDHDTSLVDITITEEIVMTKLQNLKVTSSPGPDGLSPRLFEKFRIHLCAPLTKIYQASMQSGEVPEDWRTANVTPIFKKGAKSKPDNYRQISQSSIPGKILESIIKDQIVDHLDINNLINSSQHGFTKNKSCVTNLLEFLETVTSVIDSGEWFDVVYLDFSKAFDKVPKLRLLETLKAHGIDGFLLNWLENWLSNRRQRVVLNGKFSTWKDVLSGVPQGSILGPILFLIFINCIDDEATLISIIRKFADDTKLGNKIVNDSDRQDLQNCLDNLFNWSVNWGMEFNVKKCSVIHFGRNNPLHEYSMNNVKLRQAECERDIGVTISSNLKPSIHCSDIARKANFALNQILKCFHYRDKFVFLNLYKQRVRPLLEFSTAAWNPWLKCDIDLLEKVQMKAVRAISSLKAKTYPEKLKEIKLMSLETRRTRYDLIQVYKFLNKVDNVNPDIWFKTVGENPARVTRLSNYVLNLVKSRSRLDVRSQFFSQRVVDKWNSLPTDVKTKPSINSFKNALDNYLFEL